MKMKSVILLLAALFLSATQALAVPTKVTVRVRAKDAKFIGTSFGGMLVTIRDVETGELLAKGVTQGSTGDTKVLMQEPVTRFKSVAREQDAAFVAVLDIDEPVKVEVSAYGPLAQRQGASRVSATQWVVPGKDITGGNGWVLDLPGFVVDVLAPPSHIKLDSTTVSVDIRANVTMMCGCPIKAGGVWDANKYDVSAIVKKDGRTIATLPLKYTGLASQFQTTFTVNKGPGVYRAIVYAYDPANGNTGLDTVTFIIKKPEKK